MPKREEKPKVLDFASVSTMLLGRPLAVDGAFLRAMQSAKTEPQAFFDMFSAMGPSAETTEPGIQVIKVRGSLYRGMFYDDYQDIRDLVDHALEDTNALGIVLDIDSPGGDVSGLMDLSEHILAARGDNGPWPDRR